ncbi:Hypothetical protein KVN_LOCUS487 [uncultured virus]|nr:Hypothetical protein KVN_LOCUS487 [uncultured virus]
MNTGLINNKLINSYQNYNVPNMTMQNNALLKNNPYFQNNNNSNQMQQIQMMQAAQIKKLKEIQQIKQLEKLNDLEQNLDKEKIKESLIKTINIKEDNKQIYEKLKELEQNYELDLTQFWAKRTNQPYKNILKEEDYKKDFKSKEDLIIHRVTNADKLGIDDKYEEYKDKIKKQDNELKIIYSTSKLAEHKQKFEYNYKYGYKEQYNPSDHNDLKNDRINYLKKEQLKLEENKGKLENIIESLINEGMFDREEIQKLGITKETITNSKENKPIKKHIVQIKPKDKTQNFTKSNHYVATKKIKISDNKNKDIII